MQSMLRDLLLFTSTKCVVHLNSQKRGVYMYNLYYNILNQTGLTFQIIASPTLVKLDTSSWVEVT